MATWSESTATKVKQVLAKILVENEYLDSLTSDRLNPVLISTVLENAIRSNGDEVTLSAFNCIKVDLPDIMGLVEDDSIKEYYIERRKSSI